MPLIEHKRHRADDLGRWRMHAETDRYVAERVQWSDRVLAATLLIAEFARQGPCWAFTSWGKDSTVLAHLVYLTRETLGVSVPLVYCRIEPLASPDSDLVRDAFLARFDVDYREGVASCTRAELDADSERPWAAACRAATGATYWKTRHISGIRAAESKARKMSLGHRGLLTKTACAPIGKWSVRDVWAYLESRGLPVHPAYGCTQGGMWDRDWVRVDALARRQGEERGRTAWERTYYGAELRRIEQVIG